LLNLTRDFGGDLAPARRLCAHARFVSEPQPFLNKCS
jgi:hypothetical protein